MVSNQVKEFQLYSKELYHDLISEKKKGFLFLQVFTVKLAFIIYHIERKPRTFQAEGCTLSDL